MRNTTLAIIATALFAILIAPRAMGQPARFAAVQYGDGHPRQLLDVYVPNGPIVQNRPLVVWIHGGGWIGGSRASVPGKADLLARGFVVASIDYRLSSDATFPAQIHDCKAAIRHMRQNAQVYGIDPARVGVWGSSAGGHLAALVGTSGGVVAAEGSVGAALGNTPFFSRVKAVVDFFGPTDFLGVAWHLTCDSPESKLLGACLGDIQANVNNPAWASQVANAALAGSITHASPDDPEFYIAHGADDMTVPVAHSTRLHDALTSVGVRSTLKIVPGQGHGLPLSENPPVYAFFERVLGPCTADMNSDGFLDFTDFDAFVRAFEAGFASADFNSDGFLDFTDFDVFVRAFEIGC